jgi:hypothetical protein
VNSLELNVGKCKSITFLRLYHPVEFSYMLDSIILDRVDSITDLGVVMARYHFLGILMLRSERLWQCCGL